MLFYLVHPVAHIIVALLRSAVVAQYDAISSFVIRLCYSPKSLLACSVPYLQFYISTINRHVLNLEIDTFHSSVLI